MPIPVIDLFAGPGGLGEGFSSFRRARKPFFKIALSIEKEPIEHETLQLRAFFRQFPDKKAPEEYYEYLAGIITREELFNKFRAESNAALQEAQQATLGETENKKIDQLIGKALGNQPEDWVLIGGPPCQAYSLVGRSRRKNDPTFADDKKHRLYEEYLRIIKEHRPSVFVMENVKGLLSAKLEENLIFHKILEDLKNPSRDLSYRIVSLTTRGTALLGAFDPIDFVVQAEDYGVPQARHRIILLGIRNDNNSETQLLKRQPKVSIQDVISDLPHVRSGLSKEEDSTESWYKAIKSIAHAPWLDDPIVDEILRRKIRALIQDVEPGLSRGGEFIRPARRVLHAHEDWFIDERLRSVCNHSTRSHIRPDLHRYFFVSAFGQVHRRSPGLEEFPTELLPLHANVPDALVATKFNDRFRVQIAERPSTTVTSHISKDGHYFIHYDPTQCRSLTVREAARLQTFPDNYFFEGPRTQQYHQVGNAVPPFLARQIAEVVAELFV